MVLSKMKEGVNNMNLQNMPQWLFVAPDSQEICAPLSLASPSVNDAFALSTGYAEGAIPETSGPMHLPGERPPEGGEGWERQEPWQTIFLKKMFWDAVVQWCGDAEHISSIWPSSTVNF